MNPARSAAAVLIGAILIVFIQGTLQLNLVRALADEPATEEALAAVGNRPVVRVVTVVTLALASLLSGYILAKVAGSHEVRHAIATAIVMTVLYANAFTTPNVVQPPIWARVAMLIVTPLALMAGASIRAQARSIQQEAATARPEERS